MQTREAGRELAGEGGVKREVEARDAAMCQVGVTGGWTGGKQRPPQ